jgi:hypothetical protein
MAKQSMAMPVRMLMQAVSGIAWMPWQPLPTFLTCGGDGLLLWSLAPSFLEQRQLTVADAASAPFTAVCSAAGSGCLLHSSMAGQPLDPAQQAAQQAEEAATAFAADESGTVWQLAVGESTLQLLQLCMCLTVALMCAAAEQARVHNAALADAAGDGALLGCMAVARLPAGEVATQLQWSRPSAALAVATSSGRLLRYGQTSRSSRSTSCQQWWAADRVDAAAAGCHPQLPEWESRGKPMQFDGPVTALQLEPQQLCEGVAVTAAATCWFVDATQQQLAPLLAGHAGSITWLVTAGPDFAVGEEGAAGAGLVASMCEEGWLALWCMGGQPQVSRLVPQPCWQVC